MKKHHVARRGMPRRWFVSLATVVSLLAVTLGVSAVSTPAQAATGPGWNTFASVTGYQYDHYVIRPTAAAAASSRLMIITIQVASNASGVLGDATIELGPTLGAGEVVSQGELKLDIRASGSCGTVAWPGWVGCGGPSLTGGGYLVGGHLDVTPDAVATMTDYNLRQLVAHELGHALGLDHWWGSPSQVMGPGDILFDTYQSGDAAGLNYLAGHGYRAVPYGSQDGIHVVGVQRYEVNGWAKDPDTTGAIYVDSYVSGYTNGIRSIASQYRGDVGNHAYRGTFTGIAQGSRQVCSYGINVSYGGSNPSIGCRTFTFGAPLGSFDGTRLAHERRFRLTGWAWDPDTTAASTVTVLVDGAVTGTGTANQSRADIDAAYPGAGTNHGFEVYTPALTPGSHNICVLANNYGAGGTTVPIGCKTVQGVSDDPIGSLDGVNRISSTSTQAGGWSIDPNVLASTEVHLYVDNAINKIVVADVYRPDVGEAYLYGDNHGYDTVLTGLTPGLHNVCAYAININQGTGNPLLGCKLVLL